ncbi:MAG: PEP-CTERM sorting domain-containing protein [Planctomycetota bacterium]
MRSGLAVALLVSFAFAQAADATILINEMLINHSSSATAADQDREFIELRSTTGGIETMTGLHYIYIEGDGNNSGVVDFAFDLSALSTGTNGLAVLTDGLLAWDPAADPATPVTAVEFTNDDGGGDDLENGSSTHLIVAGYTGTPGVDLDTDNDGTLDSMPWTSVISAVGWKESSTGTENTYAAALGGIEFDGNVLGSDPDAFIAAPDGNFVIDSFTTDDDTLDDGPWGIGGGGALDDSNNVVVPNPAFTLTPGSANTLNVAIPEPTSMALGAFGLGALLIRRRLAD